MKICVPVTATGEVDPRWGRASRVAVADVVAGQVCSWQEVAVGWDVLHDAQGEGRHHARIARFLLDHQIERVAVHHVGPGMQRMLHAMGVGVVEGLSGPASQQVLAAARLPA